MYSATDNISTKDNLERPLIKDNLETSLWNNKCDYIKIEQCTNLNPDNYNLVVLELNIRSLLVHQTEPENTTTTT